MDGIHLMAAAMHASQARLDVAAGNLANVSSDGFRRQVARASLDSNGIAVATSIDATPGPLEHTGRAFDLAAVGKGGLLVRSSDGNHIESLRSGSFVRDERGHLIDARGRELLGRSGPLRVSADATIDRQGLVRDGDRITDRVAHAPETSVQSGFLERSNVDAVREMVEVVVAQRNFETSQKTLSALDDVRSKVTSDVARVKS